eukprot:gnl/MRDRNA2_/MRDRNA2_19788_c0_seq1.p1 gnl/MRDRNA2_/MRDRNA2_19788_c0~~gnl/MRDRNA2_/MRDRNA2_19788_c0_seq1.p1  ORF type:complete len:163 (-),score=30.13 gnl/MRDRNA2_/MRDRNA2_19788_c0_seq1:200-688(-)
MVDRPNVLIVSMLLVAMSAALWMSFGPVTVTSAAREKGTSAMKTSMMAHKVDVKLHDQLSETKPGPVPAHKEEEVQMAQRRRQSLPESENEDEAQDDGVPSWMMPQSLLENESEEEAQDDVSLRSLTGATTGATTGGKYCCGDGGCLSGCSYDPCTQKTECR